MNTPKIETGGCCPPSSCSAFLWDAQVRQDGKWVSIYGPFEDIEDAEDVVDEGIKRATTSTAFRIIPLPNVSDQTRRAQD